MLGGEIPVNSRALGVDEVGRGCLAGPVVAGAVLVDEADLKIPEKLNILMACRDSKKLNPARRKSLSIDIQNNFKWSIQEVDSRTIDEINILQASFLAMSFCVVELLGNDAKLSNFSKIWVDGNKVIPSQYFPQFPKLNQIFVIGGDDKVKWIGAASIIAKVYRDELMQKLDLEYPGYGLGIHKGYPTSAHQSAIKKIGPSKIHRLSFGQKSKEADL